MRGIGYQIPVPAPMLSPMKRIASSLNLLSLLLGIPAGAAFGQLDFWDLPPISYSDTPATDAISKMAAELAAGTLEIEGQGALERLEFVLNKLEVPVESQVLVFSKTSLQNGRIHPKNPRSLYFSENAYVGYVPGGAMEAIIHDPVLGPVFYLIESGGKQGLRIERDTNNCLSCHATGRTEGVPGMLIRSVYPDSDGHPLLHLGTNDVSHETPLDQRWGGWYVTGSSSLPHLGNRVFSEEGDLEPKGHPIEDVGGLLDISKYPLPTSDIVALVVLEHQCEMHTLMNAAAMNYRRARHFTKTMDPGSDPDSGSAGGVAESWADKIVECMFFKDEADLGEGIEGNAGFQNAFASQFPRTEDGDSLAEFRLYGRIFKNRCSYMVYSDAFRGLPETVKGKVLARMRKVLEGTDPGIDWIGAPERKRISRILEETFDGWNLEEK